MILNGAHCLMSKLFATETCEKFNSVPDEKVSDTVYDIEKAVPKGGRGYYIAKRTIDLVFSVLALLICAIPMLIIALVVKIDSHGTVIYKQERLGKGGRSFVMYKFRTMNMNAEDNGPQWADTNDKRCTKVGSVLRRCRLDELPQLFNIIKGDMSFVGPRPERPCFYEQFETYIHGFKNRLVVKPGLTGLAQVNGGYDLKPEEKIVYDIEYIKKRSIGMDLKLIFKTFIVIFTRKGAR